MLDAKFAPGQNSKYTDFSGPQTFRVEPSAFE